MSKGYTLQYFINTFSNATVNQVNKNGAYLTVSPRLGYFSVKADALDTWLDDSVDAISEGRGHFSTYGKTPRARLLTALRNRQTRGRI
jgi:hypothetical protein